MNSTAISPLALARGFKGLGLRRGQRELGRGGAGKEQMGLHFHVTQSRNMIG